MRLETGNWKLEIGNLVTHLHDSAGPISSFKFQTPPLEEK